MAKILELSEQLANQIAAGEVVERPASVVKELVENAIDAASTQIDIYLEEAGLKKIQIVDNGEGIAQEDVKQAFKRHATSKVYHQADLFRIRTLGFRGEALPSIASVAKVTIETSVSSEESGSYLVLVGGKEETFEKAAMRQGTKVTVEHLFFNTPARLKYVKTIQTELSNVGDIVNRLALSHPNIVFRLFHEGNQMLRTSGNGDLKQAIAGVYGLQTTKKMRPIQGKDLDFNIHGYISLPEVTRASRNYISTIINGRYIKNFVLNKAITQAYGSKLMVGRFPIAIIEIEMDPLLVDVNVHPTKQEVRLSKEAELVTLLKKSISDALKEENLIPNAYENKLFAKPKLPETEKIELEMPQKPMSDRLAYDTRSGEFYVPNSIKEDQKADFSTIIEENEFQLEKNREILSEKPMSINDQVADTDDKESSSLHKTPQVTTQMIKRVVDEPITKERFPVLEYFGQMHGTYLFAQSQEGLYIIDQHAAQERIKYELFREQIGDVTTDRQALLVPIVIEYPSNEYLKIVEAKAVFEQIGLMLEPFGGYSFVIREHPAWFLKGKEEQTIRELVEMFLELGYISIKEFREATAIMMSCKQSIKANHYLDEKQARILLKELAQCSNPFNCPHGRPVLIHFSNADMEKLFKRIQDPHRSLREE